MKWFAAISPGIRLSIIANLLELTPLQVKQTQTQLASAD